MADIDDAVMDLGGDPHSGSWRNPGGFDIAEGEGILSQEEIDALLSMDDGPRINPEDLATVDALEEFLTGRAAEFEEKDLRYGIFARDPSTIQISIGQGDVKENMKALEDIREMNRAEGDEPVMIGNTELLQFSRCPECGKVYSRAELTQYYRNPFVPDGYAKERIQREDNRVHCSECGTFFTPSLVMLNKGGLGETNFLCKVQTIHAIELHYAKTLARDVLTRRRSNILQERKSVVLDVEAHILAQKPSLMTNFLQYTPIKDTVRWLAPANDERLYLFDGNLKIV